MTIATDHPTGADQTRTTRGLLITTALLVVPQLILAVVVLVLTWTELSGMTPRERADSYASLGYYVAGIMAVPPLLAGLLGGGAWAWRERPLGVGLATGAVVVSGVAVMIYLRSYLPGFVGVFGF
ncbi:hypothetical protein F0U44_16425 [Nocardioides humilatus]|uniref:Uncharacterized protein n=1 Tax=Nocardioides humilatus TaxID=2607660 RepID=A0A5B1L7S9_9ACTN|nr:hypothetical protein [Nocardioides humilatus]KAA1416781.1 hypothetical protein F0U44_16425 [Nocardioides humilatus]